MLFMGGVTGAFPVGWGRRKQKKGLTDNMVIELVEMTLYAICGGF